jgi:4-carboxymuconolactone decarboxylase
VDKKLADAGMKVRKEVLGADYVDNSMKNADAFNGPFQEILNEYCWGMAWTDERLTRKTRSIMNLCLLAALGRMHEWELHFRGAINNGCTRDELQAIIHHIAVYAGVPAGVECFRIGRKVLAELDKKA